MATKEHDTPSLKPEELGMLYPTPMTNQERQANAEARQEYFDTIRTRMAAFKIAFFGAILGAAVAYYAISVAALWMIGGMPVILFSYAVWLILGLFVFKWIRYTANIFYEYSHSSLLFWILHILSIGLVIIAWHQGQWLESTSYYWIGILAAVQFVVAYVCGKLLLRKHKSKQP